MMFSTIFETGTLRAEAARGVRGGRLKPERSVAISLLVSRDLDTMDGEARDDLRYVGHVCRDVHL
jgi:hypothetical protein